MAKNVTLSRNQRRALAAILANRTITEAAQACGLSEKTLYRYCENPAFRAALSSAEMATIDQAGRILLDGQFSALATLNDIRRNGQRDSDRRLAAQAWMDLTLRWRELRNVEQRITDLEAALYVKPK
jgi:hypothetical protein